MEVPVADHHEVIILMIQLSELCFRKGGKPLSAMKTFPSGPRGNFFWDDFEQNPDWRKYISPLTVFFFLTPRCSNFAACEEEG